MTTSQQAFNLDQHLTILSICEEITQTLGRGAEVRMDTAVRYIYLNIDN